MYADVLSLLYAAQYASSRVLCALTILVNEYLSVCLPLILCDLNKKFLHKGCILHSQKIVAL